MFCDKPHGAILSPQAEWAGYTTKLQTSYITVVFIFFWWVNVTDEKTLHKNKNDEVEEEPLTVPEFGAKHAHSPFND